MFILKSREGLQLPAAAQAPFTGADVSLPSRVKNVFPKQTECRSSLPEQKFLNLWEVIGGTQRPECPKVGKQLPYSSQGGPTKPSGPKARNTFFPALLSKIYSKCQEI